MCNLPLFHRRLIRQIIMWTLILPSLLDKMVETSSNLPLLQRRNHVYKLQWKNHVLFRLTSWGNWLKPAIHSPLRALLGRNRVSRTHEHLYSVSCSLLAHSLPAFCQKPMVLLIMFWLKLGRNTWMNDYKIRITKNKYISYFTHLTLIRFLMTLFVTKL